MAAYLQIEESNKKRCKISHFELNNDHNFYSIDLLLDDILWRFYHKQ
jgi:hypothetical protein